MYKKIFCVAGFYQISVETWNLHEAFQISSRNKVAALVLVKEQCMMPHEIKIGPAAHINA